MDIISEKIDDKKIKYYKFCYFTKADKWVPESEAFQYPSLLSNYLKRKNNLIKNKSGCTVDKDILCINKKKTRGMMVLRFGYGFYLDFYQMIYSERLSWSFKPIVVDAWSRFKICYLW